MNDMNDILWLRFPDEAVAGLTFEAEAKKKFESIFDADHPQSPWNEALTLLGFHKTPGPLIRWHEDAPYFNWTALVAAIGGGAIKTVRKADGGYAFHVSYAPAALWRLFACQWKTARFLQKSRGENALAESIALGLVLQSMMLRLGNDAGLRLAQWLAGSEPVPKHFQKTVAQMQAVQLRRTQLSYAWKEYLPQVQEHVKNLPEYFWDAPVAAIRVVPACAEKGAWTGLPVCAGNVTGKSIVVRKISEANLSKEKTGPVILVFRRARPETTELFGYADAILFAEGGVLSHACVVAREMNIPCVTGLGADFYDAMPVEAMLSVDGASGKVEITR